MLADLHILGATGMLGSALIRAALREDLRVTTHRCDLTSTGWATPPRAPVVINAAGIVKQASFDPATLIRVNACAPHALARWCEAAGARLIHVSTDCVYSGQTIGPHPESEVPDCADWYGVSKVVGEVIHAPHLTVRTSFVGIGRYGLVAQLQQAARRGVPLPASDCLRWTGHTVDVVAAALIALARLPQITGLLHLPGDQQTRWELARRLCQALNLPPETVIRDDSWIADRRLTSLHRDVIRTLALPSFAEQLAAFGRSA